MTRASDSVRLRHMLDHAREAIALVERRSRPDLDTDRVVSLALVRLVEIIGEAASRVSQPTRKQHPEIPWPQIVGLRNRLIHGYDAVDYDILWEVLMEDLPPLVSALGKIAPLEHS